MSPSKPLPPASAESALVLDMIGSLPEVASHPDHGSAATRLRAPLPAGSGSERAPRTVMERARRAANGEVRIQEDNMALEFEPAGRNKETAVANFTGQPTFRGRRPMPAGDVTDEDGFVAVKPVPRESIRVRPAAETAATGRAAGVDEIIAWRDAALEAGHEKH